MKQFFIFGILFWVAIQAGAEVSSVALNEAPESQGSFSYPSKPSFPVVEQDWGPAFVARHPVLLHSCKSGDIGHAERLLNQFSLDQLEALVPRQVAGFSWSRCPKCKEGSQAWGESGRLEDRWSWDPKQPESVVCRKCSMRFPNADFPASKSRVYLNPAGESITIALHQSGGGEEHFYGAVIDTFKGKFTRRSLGQLATAFHLTGEERYAEAGIRILMGYAQTVPHYLTYGGRGWGMAANKRGYLSSGGPYQHEGTIPEPKPTYPYGWEEGLGSATSYWFNSIQRELYQAYDLLYKSTHLSEAQSPDQQSSLRFFIENNIFDYQAEFILAFEWEQQIKNNLARQVADLTKVAKVCGRPQYARFSRDWCNALFYHYESHHDMITHEGPGYQYTWLAHIRENFHVLRDYQDPDGYIDAQGKRLECYDPDETMLRRRQVMEPSAFRFPDGTIFPIGDSKRFENGYQGKGIKNFKAKEAYFKKSQNSLIPGFGLTVLGDGAGAPEDQVQAILNWSGGTHSHSHEDVLNMMLFAKGHELISDPGKPWDSRSTFSHNTVVVDGKDNGKGIEPAGSLELFTPNLPGVAITRVEGSMAAYPKKTTRYRRTLVHNTVDLKHPYVLDIFEVEGGETHEYVLNGSHEKTGSQKGTTSLAMKRFSLPAPNDSKENRNWAGMSAMSLGPMSSNGFVDFRFEENLQLGTRTHFQRQPKSKLILGDMINFRFGKAHPYKRNVRGKMPEGHTAPKMIVRNKGKNGLSSLFVFVHEVIDGKSVIKKMNHMTQPNGVLAVKVDLGKRKDYYALALEESTELSSGPLKADGIFAAAATQGKACDLWLVGGQQASCFSRCLRATDASVMTGKVDRVVRMENGAAADAYRTDAPLPAGDTLQHEAVLIEFLDDQQEPLFTLTSEIESVLEDGEYRWVTVRQDAGIFRTPDGKWREIFYPHREASHCRLKVVGSASSVPQLNWSPKRARYDAFDENEYTLIEDGPLKVWANQTNATVGISDGVINQQAKGSIEWPVSEKSTLSLLVSNPRGVMRPRTQSVTLLPLQPPTLLTSHEDGLVWEDYNGHLDGQDPDTMRCVASEVCSTGINQQFKKIKRHHSARFSGYIEIPETGRYRFFTRQSGSAILNMGTETVVRHNALCQPIERHGEILLKKGFHPISYTYAQDHNETEFELQWQGPSFDKQPIPAAQFVHEAATN